MPIITYPLNDKEYTASDAETYLSTRTSGVYSSDGHFAASITGDRQITISPGLAWINNGRFKGKSVASTEPIALDIPAAGTLPRKDLIVLRFDATQNDSIITVKSGSESSLPSIPPVERSEGVYELGLYSVSVTPGNASVSASDVQSLLLDEAYCGVMRDGVTAIPTAQIQAQATAIMKSLIDNLSAQITNITTATVTRGDGVGEPTCTVEFSDDASHVIFHFDNVNGQSVTHTFKDNILTFESASGKTTIDLTPSALGVYSKSETVSDNTKAAFGLKKDAVPDDVFNAVKSSLDGASAGIAALNLLTSQSARVAFGVAMVGSRINVDFRPVILLLGNTGYSTADFALRFLITWRGNTHAFALGAVEPDSPSGSGPLYTYGDPYAVEWNDNSVFIHGGSGIGSETAVPYVIIGVPNTEG